MSKVGSKKINITVPVNWLWAIVAIGLSLIVTFFVIEDAHRPALVFVAAVVAGCAALVTAINNVDQRISAAKTARVGAAIDLFHRWNDPKFLQCKLVGAEIRKKFREENCVSVDARLAFLREDPTRRGNLIDILNRLEALSIALDNNVVDEETCKRFFRTIVLEYWSLCEDVVKKMRAEAGPRLFKELEALYERWKD